MLETGGSAISEHCDLSKYEEIMRVNTKSMVMVTKYAVPYLIQTKGDNQTFISIICKEVKSIKGVCFEHFEQV